MELSPSSPDVEKKIAAFLCAAHPSAADGTHSILTSHDLFSDGWLDSLLHLRLLAFLEKEFDLRVSPFQITRKSFQSVGSIAALLTQRG